MDKHKVKVKEVFTLAYPSMLGMVSLTIQNFIDTIFLGHVGKSQLAAVGLTTWIIITILAFFKCMMSSTNTFTARYCGSKKFKFIGVIVWHELYIAFFFGIFIFLIGQFSGIIIKLINPNDRKSYIACQSNFNRIFREKAKM